MTTPNETHAPRTDRPNFWLRAIDIRKHQLAHEYRATLGDRSREGISDEDYATTMATLEKMARNLGWTEDQFDERPFGRGFGRGRKLRHHAMMHGFGPRHPFHERHGETRQDPHTGTPEA